VWRSFQPWFPIGGRGSNELASVSDLARSTSLVKAGPTPAFVLAGVFADGAEAA
jgi:hypothetical protein